MLQQTQIEKILKQVLPKGKAREWRAHVCAYLEPPRPRAPRAGARSARRPLRGGIDTKAEKLLLSCGIAIQDLSL
jgi:hypothetical protein